MTKISFSFACLSFILTAAIKKLKVHDIMLMDTWVHRHPIIELIVHQSIYAFRKFYIPKFHLLQTSR